jgi:hypothetical protein
MPSINKLLQAAAGNAGGDNLYVEDVFSTYLYTGNGSTQSITNDIDISTEGGMVWIKNRDAADGHVLTDTERGAGEVLASNSTAAEVTNADTTTAFNSDGFSIGADVIVNTNTEDYASWTFRKAEKFFDVVTYTGDGTNGREIPHSLAGDVGMVIVKCTSDADQWLVWHKSTPTGYLKLNGTGALVTSFAQFKFGNGTTTVNPTSSVFTVAGDSDINGSGRTYVAYLFASDAGGFGDDGDESIITCGGFTTDGSGLATVNLGYEPQWLMIKRTGTTGDWQIVDTMRGFVNNSSGGDAVLKANSSDAESTFTLATPTSTGFLIDGNAANAPIIYIAIRRPMKTPESGTEVFAPVNRTATAPTYYTGFVTDMQIMTLLSGFQNQLTDRLRGQKKLLTNATDAESAIGTEATYDWMTGVGNQDSASSNNIAWNFKRATGFMDVVAYTGTGSATTQAHNLGVVPEMMIIKNRDQADNWAVYHNGIGPTKNLKLNLTNAEDTDSRWWDDTAPTDSIFSLSYIGDVNASGENYIAYLFATLAGVSKVGSYTGTGATLNVDCGFTAGARFILIKRTDSTGDWYVYDSLRGIVAGNDPYLLLNSAAAEVTGTDYIDPLNAGFTVTSSAPAGLNASGGSYIFLSIA